MQSKSRKKSKWFDDFEVLKDWKRRKVRPEFWGVNEAPKSLHHFHRVILKNLHWLPPLRFWTVLGKYLKNNLCKFHIRSWVVTRVRTDCLTPTLHVASMGSALVVYTLEAVVVGSAQISIKKMLGTSKIHQKNKNMFFKEHLISRKWSNAV